MTLQSRKKRQTIPLNIDPATSSLAVSSYGAAEQTSRTSRPFFALRSSFAPNWKAILTLSLAAFIPLGSSASAEETDLQWRKPTSIQTPKNQAPKVQASKNRTSKTASQKTAPKPTRYTPAVQTKNVRSHRTTTNRTKPAQIKPTFRSARRTTEVVTKNAPHRLTASARVASVNPLRQNRTQATATPHRSRLVYQTAHFAGEQKRNLHSVLVESRYEENLDQFEKEEFIGEYVEETTNEQHTTQFEKAAHEDHSVLSIAQNSRYSEGLEKSFDTPDDDAGFESVPDFNDPDGITIEEPRTFDPTADPTDPTDPTDPIDPTDPNTDEPSEDLFPEPNEDEEDLTPFLDEENDNSDTEFTASEAEKDCAAELKKMKARRLSDISLDINLKGVPGKDFPYECGLDDGTPYKTRNWCYVTYNWEASRLYHKPLYFEHIQLERYGHSFRPMLQPIVSGVHFFGTLPILPYKMGLKTPNECEYALGFYRPGNCAPYFIEPIPFTWRAALFQAGAVTGTVFVLP